MIKLVFVLFANTFFNNFYTIMVDKIQICDKIKLYQI